MLREPDTVINLILHNLTSKNGEKQLVVGFKLTSLFIGRGSRSSVSKCVMWIDRLCDKIIKVPRFLWAVYMS